MLRALRGRNYQLFFVGQGVSLIGTWMQGTAQGWLVYRMTGSKALLGVVAFASQIMTLLLSPVAGVVADRTNRRRLLVITQTAALLQAVTLAALTLSGVIQVWHIVALAALMGSIMGLDIPVRQSFVVEMVDRREDLPNAIALNSSLFNAARIAGPALAGMLIAALTPSASPAPTLAPVVGALAGVTAAPTAAAAGSAVAAAGLSSLAVRGATGEGVCFLLNALSYLAVVGSLLAMRVKPRQLPTVRKRVLREMREGFAYVWSSVPMRSLLMLLAFMSLVGMQYAVLMPVFAEDILHGDARTQGLLLSSAGAGALTGAIYLANRQSVLGLGRLIALGPAVMGAALVGFALSRVQVLSCALLFVSGLGMMIQSASTNTLLQTIVDEDKRGRMMSIWTMSFAGMGTLGGLMVGGLAQGIGAPLTVVICGILCIAATLVFTRQLPRIRAATRPIYQRLGILPAAEGAKGGF
jgi:MFS family permease